MVTDAGPMTDIGEDTLNEDEVTIISAVLELSDKPLSLIMTPIEFVYSLSSDTILDQAAVDEVRHIPFLHRSRSRVRDGSTLTETLGPSVDSCSGTQSDTDPCARRAEQLCRDADCQKTNCVRSIASPTH